MVSIPRRQKFEDSRLSNKFVIRRLETIINKTRGMVWTESFSEKKNNLDILWTSSGNFLKNIPAHWSNDFQMVFSKLSSSCTGENFERRKFFETLRGFFVSFERKNFGWFYHFVRTDWIIKLLDFRIFHFSQISPNCGGGIKKMLKVSPKTVIRENEDEKYFCFEQERLGFFRRFLCPTSPKNF